MGIPYGISNTGGQIRMEDSFEILGSAFKHGVTTLDTAEAYGNAHEIIGKFHRKNPSMTFDVITKLPHVIDKDIDLKVKGYLEELNIGQLKSLLFHSFTTYRENLVRKGLLKKLKADGFIKNLGVSVYTNDEFEEVIKDEDIDVIQIPYNVFDNKNIRGKLIAQARTTGKKEIHTRSCFLQGLFFQPLDSEKAIVKRLKEQLKQLHELSHRSGFPVQQLALAYCTKNPLIDKVLIGVDSKTQLEQNIQLSDAELPLAVIEELNAIEVKDLSLLNPSLWNTL